jgi:hypothetical protein
MPTRARAMLARFEHELAEEDRKARRVVRPYPRASAAEQGLV